VEVLDLLLERPGRVVTREELHQKLWPKSTFVDFDHGLNDAVKRLRVALGDSADKPRFVETVPRRGYRFIYPVEGLERRPWTRSRAWQAGLAALGLVGLLVVGWLLYFRPAQALTEGDYVLLTDFVNTTGDEVFNGTLKQALAVKLDESPFLEVFPERMVQETLQLMEREADEPITEPVAQEICEREGIKAMLLGEIAPLGTHYVISLNAVNCQTGESLAREQVEAAGKDEVLGALDRAISPLRKTLGESLSSIEEFDTPLEEATTSSLEALKAYTLAREQQKEGRNYSEATPFLKRAIELDPEFAMAYSMLGDHEKAYELRKRVSQWERLDIEWKYYFFVTKEVEKENEVYKLWQAMYPSYSAFALTFLAANYKEMGRSDEALEAALEALRRNPRYPQVRNMARMNLGDSYMRLHRFQEAKAVFEEALQDDDRVGLHLGLYLIAFIEGDAAAMGRQAGWATGKSSEYMMVTQQAHAAAFQGRMAEARELYRRAIGLARQHRPKTVVSYLTSLEALVEAHVGNYAEGRKKATAALALAPDDRDTMVSVALTFALSGAVDEAQALADELAERFPTHTLLNAVWLPTVRAAIEIESGNPARGFEVLQAIPYELGASFALDNPAGLHPPFCVRGEALLRMGRAAEAVAEFQKLRDHRGTWPNSTLHAVALLGQARAYALAGDTSRSRKAYQDFFALWKDADPDIPILLEAQAEYAKLEASETSVPAN
jgi:tetratricopeptide (TPR) repeat protein